MIIGIDASRANKPHKTGVEWYSYHLIEQLKQIDRENHYFLYTDRPLEGDLAKCPANFEEVVLSWPLPRFWTLGRLSLEMKWGKKKPDVLFVPAHTIPLLTPRATVVTVHDIGFEHFPELYPWADKLYHRFSIKIIKRKVDRILTVSNYSKEDICDFYNIPKHKVKVVLNGYDNTKYKQMSVADYDLEKFKIFDDYILFVGRLEEKKNTPRLIEAFGEFKKKHPTDKHKLVLVGKEGFGFDRVVQNIEKYKLQDQVIMPGWVGDNDLPKLLNRAKAFIFPSLFEGFGIPIVEAMACGCPVLCSNTTSLPEAAGEAAVLFDPVKTSEIVSALERVLLDDTIRQTLSEKGLRHSAKLSWQKCAVQTLDIITNV